MTLGLATTIVLLYRLTVTASTLRVPGEFATIRSAIRASVDGDVVLIDPGTYLEAELDFGGREIVVQGTEPTDSSVVANTVVDGMRVGSIFVLDDGEGPLTALAGLTLRGGLQGGGGAIYLSGSHARITHCVLSDNVAGDGGALRLVDGASSRVSHCRFERNSSNDGHGGAISIVASRIQLDRCVFSDNHSAETGGALYARNASVTTEGSRFVGNTADDAGGHLRLDGGEHVLQSSVFEEGRSGGSGAAVSLRSAGLKVENSWMTGNVAALEGGAIALHDAAADLELIHTTLRSNRSHVDAGGALFSAGIARVDNSILWQNGESQLATSANGTIEVGHALIQGGWPGVRVITDNPQFASGEGFHLGASSPALDAGDPRRGLDVDLEGQPRPSGAGFDLGADEVQGLAASAPPTTKNSAFMLRAAPNPFNPRTRLSFTVEAKARVQLTIHDTSGHRLTSLRKCVLSAGTHTVPWNGKDAEGRTVASGIYIARLQVNHEATTRPLLIVK